MSSLRSVRRQRRGRCSSDLSGAHSVWPVSSVRYWVVSLPSMFRGDGAVSARPSRTVSSPFLMDIDCADIGPAVYINLPVGGVAALLIFLSFQMPSTAKPQKASLKEKISQMDIPGLAAILGAIICYL